MAFPLNIAKAVFRWQLVNNTEGINVLHFKRFGSTDFGTVQCQEVAESLHDWYSNSNFKTETNSAWKAALDSTQELLEITVSDVGPGPTVQYVENVGEVGTVTGTPLPVETSVVTTWRTLTPGRSGRGRTFWSGFDTNALDDSGGMGASVLAQVETACQALIDGFNTEGDYFPVVFSPKNSAGYPITTVTAQPVLHHQRRRNG